MTHRELYACNTSKGKFPAQNGVLVRALSSSAREIRDVNTVVSGHENISFIRHKSGR